MNTPNPSAQAAQATENNGKADVGKIFSELGSSPQGLTSAEAATRLQKFGRNELVTKEKSNLEKFLAYFWNPIAWMIEAAAILSLLMGHWADLSIILLLLFYNAISGFWEERKASDALAALKAGLAPKANARRDGEFRVIDAAEVVPGDVLRIKLGEVVPADVRFIEGDFISIDQAALTGESLPVTKNVGDEGYSGSIAKQGAMNAVVTGTGNNTFFGRTASLVATAGRKSHSQEATTQIGDFLIGVSVVLCIILVGFELYRELVIQDSWAWSNLANIARMVLVLLIASIPVAMPTVMTVTNALGAQQLARKQAIVSRLEAIEELAGVDTLCSDKTGTLTKNQLALGEPALFAAADAAEIALAATLASEQGSEDAIDKAIRESIADKETLKAYELKKFIPFDPVAKRAESRMTSPEGKVVYFSKGAPQVIVALCAPDQATADKAAATVQELASRGLRALGVARSDDEGKSWRFLGILSMFDPPRDDSRDTIERAKEHGLTVKMVTGDDVAIGNEISSQLGMGNHLISAAEVFTPDIDVNHVPPNIAEGIERADGFGRVFPEHKFAIVKALQERGHIVAMTGDGVNDAPALKQADCGVAVSGATDAARAAAALILTAPGLSTIIDAIEESRRIFERIINYILFRVAMTLDIMAVVVLATVFFGVTPLTPVMIIMIALLDDIPIMTIAYDNTALPKEPVRWRMRLLLVGASIMGLLSIAESFGLLIVAMSWLKADPAHAWYALTKDQVQTAVFLQIVAGGHLLLFVVRARGWMFYKPWPAKPLLCAVVGTQLLAVLMCGFGWFVTALPWAVIAVIWAYMLVWTVLLDLAKRAIYRRVERIQAKQTNVEQMASALA